MHYLVKLVVLALVPSLAVANFLFAAFVESVTFETALLRTGVQTAAILLFRGILSAAPNVDREVALPHVAKAAWYSSAIVATLTFGALVLHGEPFIKVWELMFFEAIAIGAMAYLIKRGLRSMPTPHPFRPRVHVPTAGSQE